MHEIDSEELSEWIAYFNIVGPPDPWLQAGTVCATMANVMGAGKKRYKPADFVPARRGRTVQTAAQQMAMLDAMAMRQQMR